MSQVHLSAVGTGQGLGVGVKIVMETGGHNVAVATEISLKVTLLHYHFKGVAFLDIIHEVDLMAEHIRKLEGQVRTFTSFGHGIEERSLHFSDHTHDLGINGVNIDGSCKAPFGAADDKAAILIDILE